MATDILQILCEWLSQYEGASVAVRMFRYEDAARDHIGILFTESAIVINVRIVGGDIKYGGPYAKAGGGVPLVDPECFEKLWSVICYAAGAING